MIASMSLSGLVKCERCGRALTAAESGKYTYYVWSLLKTGKEACATPRLFEETVIGQIRDHILTESNIRDLVRMLDEEMDGVAREQRQRLETIEQELADVRRRLGSGRSSSPRTPDAGPHQSTASGSSPRSPPTSQERRVMLDSADTIAAYATEMSGFLKTSEITEARSCGRSSRRSWSGLAGPRSTTRFPRRRTAPSVEPTPRRSPYLAELMSTVRVGGR